MHGKENNINYNQNKTIMNMVINKSNITFKEINLYLKEFESINAETLKFQNFLIQSSLYDYFFSGGKYNKTNNEINENDKINKSLNLKFSSNDLFGGLDENMFFLNFEKDFFEININNKIKTLHCSELINFINHSNHIINLYLNNFPLIYLNKIKNPIIEFIFITNFFNFDKDITFPCSIINSCLPKLKKIKINYSNFSDSKEITFIKKNNVIMKDITLNLKEDIIKINYNLMILI